MELSSGISLVSIHNGVRGGVSSSSSNSLRKMQDFRSLHHGLQGYHSCDGGGIKDLHQALRLSSSGGHGRKLVLELAQNGAMKMKVITNNSSSSSSEPAASSSSPSSSSSAAGFSSSTSASGGAAATSTTSATNRSKNGGFVARVLEVPGRVWQQVLHPLSDFGFGKRSVWEGGVGLFVMAGGILLAITLVWVKGKQIRARTRKYEAVLEFALAQGITVGTPVRIRGVDVGSVVGVRPSLERIDVVVELLDSGIVIPRNALVEVNQSGLISETLIDVTPRLPLPKPTLGPLDPGCSEEGLIVCDRERIKGEQGVSLDELVGICTKIARQVDGIGVANMAGMAERLGNAVEEAKPLLAKVQGMAEDIGPLLKEVREGGLLKELEQLTKVATESGRDLGLLSKSVLTSENKDLLRDSVSTLSKTLKHVESISADVSGVTGDSRTRHNLRQLIESLSRLVTD